MSSLSVALVVGALIAISGDPKAPQLRADFAGRGATFTGT
jgi:hypothetical protein